MNIKIQNENNFYQTADMSLAAALYLFYPLEAIDKQNPRKAVFCFKRDDTLDEIVENFWRGALKIDPQLYFNALRAMKSRLYGER